MYKEHPNFKPPPDDAVLWRYMDFTKFVSLLEKRALYFARADKLGDPFEGATPRYVKLIRHLALTSGAVSGSYARHGEFMEQLRRFMLINCWHESPHESAAMWRLYSREKDGIAIKTDCISLKNSMQCDAEIHVGRVSYVDYDRHYFPEHNAFVPFLHKRKSFEHERETRAIYVELPANSGILDTSKDICDIGKYFKVNISLLIKRVIVAPYADEWFLDQIESVATHYNLDAPVSKSTLAEVPAY